MSCMVIDVLSILTATACRYEKPTAIQAQALPAALSGRDVLVSFATNHPFLTADSAEPAKPALVRGGAVCLDLTCLMVHVTADCSRRLPSHWQVEAGLCDPEVTCLSWHCMTCLLFAGYRQNRIRQNSCFCAPHAGSHHGSGRGREGSWPYRCHRCSNSGACRTDPQRDPQVQQSISAASVSSFWRAQQI